MQTAAHNNQLHAATHTAGATEINMSTEQTDKENVFLLCRCHFNKRTDLPTRKWSL